MEQRLREQMTTLRNVQYVRHEFHGDPEPYAGLLLTFVYDIPYFNACGVFPPYHIVNQIFSNGGDTGGMSPGATWAPFTITREEYDELIAAVADTPVCEIQPHARYAELPMKIDHDFDHIQDRFKWMKAVCARHRDHWHDELRRTQQSSGSE
jgi:hypothetical protein